MQNKPGEIPILDNLRAIAAWSVCLYHFICTTTGLISKENWIYKTAYFGQFGVHLFFIISGMVIPWSLYKKRYHIKNIFNFLVKRLIRLEPPYLFSILLVIAVLLLRRYSPSYDGVDREITARQVLLHLGYLVPFFENISWLNNVYWTLAIEFQYYFAVGLLYFLFVSPLIYWRVAGYLILMAAPFISSSPDFLPFWLPMFGIGIALFLFKSELTGITESALVLLCFVIHLWIFNSPVASVIGAMAIFVILFFFKYSNKLLSFLGKLSYSVYLIHPILGATFVNVFSHQVSTPFAKCILIGGGLVITFIGSYLMYLVIERPSKKLSSKLAYTK